MNETGLKHVTTEDDIKEKLGGEQLIPIFLVKGCFEKFIQRNIHVIVQVPATDKFLRVKGSHERLKMSRCFCSSNRLDPEENFILSLKNFGIITNEGLTEFWRSVCVKVKSAIPAYVDEASFSTKLKNEKIRASAFEGLFNKDRTSLRDIILIIDEASRPINDNETSWSYSFFAEVKDLLAQYAEDNKFEIEVDNIAADVYSLTLGHKGLVGNCCYYFEQKIMSGAIKATLDD
ncbi:uncharacterized protein OCT59_019172 [Rhizophagus irregularis]|uniref:uncharacterized protein n=1 Tax=Rhizophagus irregularis TaxID=588596 RepID=UPI0019F5F743|nr:hypothetical protein OCT59_019172 [Rhizophagus irregularis]GET62455.1 hypothetical protein GLOIN_2v1871116 [Rhizophagus irregularis DAOM 181602=DAOM 197198]CAB4485938.1 unnamed protein product [Rhizophagus irregularis]